MAVFQWDFLVVIPNNLSLCFKWETSQLNPRFVEQVHFIGLCQLWRYGHHLLASLLMHAQSECLAASCLRDETSYAPSQAALRNACNNPT